MEARSGSKKFLAILETVLVLIGAMVFTLVLSAFYLVVQSLIIAIYEMQEPQAPDWTEFLRTQQSLQRALPALLTIQAIVFIGLGFLFMKLRVRTDSDERRRGVVGAVVIGLAAAVSAFALTFVIGMLMTWLGVPIQEQPWILELAKSPATLLRMAPLMVVLVPIAEELLLRGYVFRFLYQRAGPTAGYLGSSLLFALIHFNPSGFLVYTAIGIVLAYSYRRSANLLAPITGHMCFNAMVFLWHLIGA